MEDVFRRNARFSEVSEVPLLGTVDEDVDRVHDFYEQLVRRKGGFGKDQ